MTTNPHNERKPSLRKITSIGFKALSQFDEFIQNSLEKFKFVDAKKEYYDITGDDANYIISHKSTIPDLVIWNKTFNKNECFEGANTAKDNPFPRFQFYLRVKAMKQQETKEKKKKEKDKKKSSTTREQDDILTALNSTNTTRLKEKDKAKEKGKVKGKDREHNKLKERDKEKERDIDKDKDKLKDETQNDQNNNTKIKEKDKENQKEIAGLCVKTDFEPDYNTLPINIMKSDNVKESNERNNKQPMPTSQKEHNDIEELNKNLKMFHFDGFANNNNPIESTKEIVESEEMKFKESVFNQNDNIIDYENEEENILDENEMNNDEFNNDKDIINPNSNTVKQLRNEQLYLLDNQTNINRNIDLNSENFFNTQNKPKSQTMTQTQAQAQSIMQTQFQTESTPLSQMQSQPQLQQQPQPHPQFNQRKHNFNLDIDDIIDQNEDDPFNNQNQNYSKTPFFQKNKGGLSLNQPRLKEEVNLDNPDDQEFDFNSNDQNMIRMQMQNEINNQLQPPKQIQSQKSLNSKKKKEKKPKKQTSSPQFNAQDDLMENDYFDSPMLQFPINPNNPYQQQGMPFPMTPQMNRGFYPHQSHFPDNPMTPPYSHQQNFFQPPPLNDILLSLVGQYFDDKGWFITDREGKILASFTSFELFQFLNQRRDFDINALIITALNSPLIFNGEQIWMILSQTLPIILQNKQSQMASLEEMNQFQKKQKKKKKTPFDQEQQQQQNNYNIHLQYIANELTFNNYPIMNNLQGNQGNKMNMSPMTIGKGHSSNSNNSQMKQFNISDSNYQNMMYQQQQQHQLHQQKLQQQMYFNQTQGQSQGLGLGLGQGLGDNNQASMKKQKKTKGKETMK